MATASTSRRTDAGHLVVLSRSITYPRHMGPVMILAVEFASGGFAQRGSRTRRRGHVTTPLRQRQPDQSRVLGTFIRLPTCV